MRSFDEVDDVRLPANEQLDQLLGLELRGVDVLDGNVIDMALAHLQAIMQLLR
ncbi:MAG: hypothetical protein IH891_04335 [Planctomycetes bacterium]|nr:hypothetical protein [Planctomycetota bacterium]